MDTSNKEIRLFLLGYSNVLNNLDLRFGRDQTASLELVKLTHEWYDQVIITSINGSATSAFQQRIPFHSLFLEKEERQPMVKILRRRLADELRLVRRLVVRSLFRLEFLPLLTTEHFSPIRYHKTRFMVLKPQGLAIFSRALEGETVVLTLEWDYSYDGHDDHEPPCPSGEEAIRVDVKIYRQGPVFSHYGGERERDAIRYLRDVPDIKLHKI